MNKNSIRPQLVDCARNGLSSFCVNYGWAVAVYSPLADDFEAVAWFNRRSEAKAYLKILSSGK